MIYAVIDTNVVVSSLLSKNDDSPTKQVISYIYAGQLVPLVNQEIISEYSEVLNRDKFNFDSVKISDMLDVFRTKGSFTRRVLTEVKLPDNDDLIFYETYISVSDSYLVSGNLKHFPEERRIVSPADMVQIIRSYSKQSDLLSDPAGEYMSDGKREILYRSFEAFESLRADAIANGTAGMSMEEIDEEIRLYRLSRTK